ncbi:hypothetical protein RRG08_041228 [Elysia crispata]|uniref:Uncharacterized protein n=1 Tax=Elysia crispata TaxID=231223 RepID=A0AAE0YYI2_9GAST|nr:hypothetical protein RRG08_041228 [Elysia crispata]
MASRSVAIVKALNSPSYALPCAWPEPLTPTSYCLHLLKLPGVAIVKDFPATLFRVLGLNHSRQPPIVNIS